MFYGDRGYCVALARDRTKEVVGPASTSGGRDEHAKEEDGGVPEHLGASSAGRGVSAVRPRRLRRAAP